MWLATCFLPLFASLILKIKGTNHMHHHNVSGIRHIQPRIEQAGLRLHHTHNHQNMLVAPQLKRAPLPDINATYGQELFVYNISFRQKFASEGRVQIWQGSHTVEIPLAILTYLSRLQHAAHIKGSIGEIGVHGGLFFIGLAHLAFEGDKLWACDVFEKQQSKNVDGSGFGVKAYFLDQCSKHGIPSNQISIYEGSSVELSLDFASQSQLHPFRIFSVDGGHTRQLTVNDLTIAAANLAPGGIIVLDDVLNIESWPGVIDGLFTWLILHKTEFGPFLVGHNKVFLVERSYHGLYYHAMEKHPFWCQYLQTDPKTNRNIHKSGSSGKNHFSWGGFEYLYIDPNVTPPPEKVMDQWLAEM